MRLTNGKLINTKDAEPECTVELSVLSSRVGFRKSCTHCGEGEGLGFALVWCIVVEETVFFFFFAIKGPLVGLVYDFALLAHLMRSICLGLFGSHHYFYDR